ncbi:MAG: DUF2628 domain-containing protein [Clostridiales bacterium]|nr:DUF2628 domain-containing protein [Clostridiales bacterium]
MYCGNCGELLNDNATICTKCGCMIKPKAKVLDLSSLSPYYQQEFQKIYDSGETYKGKFNICAFLFSPIWALAKGCYLSAIANFAINFVGVSLTFGIAAIAWDIFYGFKGTYVYYCSYTKDEKRVI